jgi:16S rRNA (cytosine967-C5)-methyltransferase
MDKKNRTTRHIALAALCSWEERGLPLDQVLEEELAGVNLADPRDRQFIRAMVFGVARWRGFLDWVVGQYSSRPVAKMESRVLQGLRLGLFQLLFLDRVPASAAINETVQALKTMRQPKWLTGFVNGVLRGAERNRKNIPDPRHAAAVGRMPEPARLSHPEWLLKRWEKRFGRDETETLCRANNTVAPVTLRVNTTLISPATLLQLLQKEGVKAEPGAYSPVALRLADHAGPVVAIPGFSEGLFQVQDEAAQLVSYLPGPLQPGSSCLDACAGLGGKTSHLAQVLPANVKLVAAEPNSSRSRKLKENLGRLRLDHLVTIVEGALAALLPHHAESFHNVLVDAPCSGLGVIRRRPDIRWNRSAADLRRYQAKQLEILETAARLVAVQGILVYATCSNEPEENETVVEKFLAKHPEFSLTDCGDKLPGPARALVDSSGFFRTLPGREDLDGFFAARMVKKELKSEE